MLKRSGTFLFLRITTSLVSSALLIIGLAAPGSAQQVKERTVRIITFSDQPVDIVGLQVKSGPVQPDQRFQGDSDWFNGMTVTIKNMADKPVVFTNVLVTAHHEKDGVRKLMDGQDLVAGFDLIYGARPLLPGEPARNYRTVRLLPVRPQT